MPRRLPIFARSCAISAVLLLAFAERSSAQVEQTKRRAPTISCEAAAAVFRNAVARDELRGCVLFVARRGEILLHEAMGWRDAAKKRRMRKTSLFRLASNTKPLISTAVLMLADEDKIDLQAPVGRYLPAFANEACKTITVHHLLTHTSGLRIPTLFLSPLMQASEEHPQAPTLQLEVDRFASVGPAHTPGTSYAYSNPGYNTLGALVEKVSGMSLARFLRKRIYAPLGMKDACNHESKADPARMSAVFRRTQESAWRVSWKPGDAPTLPFVRASGDGICTAADYARFLQAWLDDGKRKKRKTKPRILRAETVRKASQPHSAKVNNEAEHAKQERYYGYGWSVHPDGVLSHGGSDGTFAWIDPKRELLVVAFTQCTGGPSLTAAFRKALLDALD